MRDARTRRFRLPSLRLFRRRRLRFSRDRRARARAPRLQIRARRHLLHRSPWFRFRRLRRLHARRRSRFDLYGAGNQQIIRVIALLVSLVAMVVVALLARPARSQTAGVTDLLSSPALWPTTGSPSATTALAQDPTAVFLNPAGLATQDERSVLVQHGLLQFGTDWDVAAVGYPIPGLGAVGLGVARLGTSGLDAYDAANEPLGSYGYTETALAASVARRAIGPVWAGATFKVLSQSLGDVSAAAPAIDLGLVYRPAGMRGAQIGFTAENLVAGALDLGGPAPVIGRSFRLGLASPDLRVGRAGAVRAALDLARHGGEGTKMRLGLEYARPGLGALRAGFDHGRPVFGVGFQYRRYGVDLALARGETEMTKQVGVRVAFGEPVSQYEARRAAEVARAADDSIRARYASRVAVDRARAAAAERDGDYETALVLWEVLARDLPGDRSIAAHSDAARAAIAARAKRDVDEESRHRLTTALAGMAREALARGDVEEATGLTRALTVHAAADSGAAGPGRAPGGPAADTLALLESRIGAARDTAADRAVSRADSLRGQGRLLAAAGEAALALRLRPGDPRATAIWTALEGSFGKSAAEASVLTRRLEALAAVHEASLAFNDGRYADAAKAVSRALAADPSSAEAREWRERVNRRLSTPKPELDARVKQLYIRGMEAYTAGDYPEALRSWEQILVLDPLNESARRNVLEARERMKSEARR